MHVKSRIAEIGDGDDADKPHTIIIERSALTQMSVFVSRAVEQKLMNEEQQLILHRIYAMIPIPFNKRIFVNTSVDTCLKRIQLRGRDYEMSCDEDYLQDLHTRMYRNYLSLQQEQCAYKAVIDGEQNQDEMKTSLIQIINDTQDQLNEFTE